MQSWLGRKLWVAGEISRTFHVPPQKLLFSEHHRSHAASAFLTSPFDEAAILTIDGVGESATTDIWRGNRTTPHIEPVAEVVFPHSLGLFYSAMTAFLGFAVNEGEYKVMGMAAFGRPRFMEQMRKLVRLGDQGGFEPISMPSAGTGIPPRALPTSWSPCSASLAFRAHRSTRAPPTASTGPTSRRAPRRCLKKPCCMSPATPASG